MLIFNSKMHTDRKGYLACITKLTFFNISWRPVLVVEEAGVP